MWCPPLVLEDDKPRAGKRKQNKWSAGNLAVSFSLMVESEQQGEPPPPRFAERLRELGVDPLSVGQVIVASWEPNEGRVLQAIRELGLEQQIIFNKGAVMVLPPGVNKATGIKAAAAELGLSPLNIAAVGDAEAVAARRRAAI